MRWNQLPAHVPAPISLSHSQQRSYQPSYHRLYHRFYRLLLLVCFSLFLPKLASATQLEFTIDTSALTGSGAVFAFDLVGGGDSVNSLVISGLQAPASSSSGPSTGNVSGSFPSVTLNTAGSFFNEAQLIVPTLGTLITFRVDTTGIAPSNGGTPDAFSLFLLDPSGSQPLFGTSDPTGANALFLLNIGSDGGNLALYEAENGLVKVSVHPVISSPVPEPASLAMLLTGLLLMLALTPAGAAVRRRAGVALFSSVLALAASGTAHAQTQVQDALDGKVSIVKSGLVLNRVTNTYDGTLTIKNTSASLISAPLTVTIKDISAAGVSVYNKSASDADGNAQVAASLALGLLKPGATVTVPVKFLNKKPAAFSYSVAVTGALLDSANSATLQVKVLNFSGDDEHPAGSPAGAGVSLVIGGQVRGVTDANGVATFPSPPIRPRCWRAAPRPLPEQRSST
jgi:hypothetical protein